jgi:SAM-dependent methyltransferase
MNKDRFLVRRFQAKIKKLFQIVRSTNPQIFLKWIIHHLANNFTNEPISGFDNIKVYFYGKNGLEIGGPSSIFMSKSILPIYPIVKNLDNCNFSRETVWEGKITEGLNFNYYGNKLGYQFIREATDLTGIGSETYDFILSSHVLEHIANPLKALFEWKRVLKNGGVLLLVIPHKQCTFDHRRPVTDLDHLIKDYENKVDEHDMSHLKEIIELHDLSMDPEAGTFEKFILRAKDNFKNRCLHHHVFITEEIIRVIDYIGLKILLVVPCLPHHIIVLAQKINQASYKNNLEELLDENAYWRQLSPFTLDRKTNKIKSASS